VSPDCQVLCPLIASTLKYQASATQNKCWAELKISALLLLSFRSIYMRQSWQYKEGRVQEEREIGVVAPPIVKYRKKII